MDRSVLVKQYLDWSNRNTEKLFRFHRLPKPRNVVPVVEWPIFSDDSESEKFIVSAQKGGYKAVNFSLLKYSQNLYTDRRIQSIKGILDHGSAHGSSIKRQVKTGILYRQFLDEDLSLMEKLDPERQLTVNYDLFAGHPSDLYLDENFEKCRKSNFENLRKILGLPESEHSAEWAIVEKIISEVATVYKNSGYKIVFEIPGSKGWSMMPEINTLNLNFIIKTIEKYIPDAKLCIDVGHVLTWSQDVNVLNSYLNILKKYSSMIAMLHISSAASWSNEFVELFDNIYPDSAPDWHKRGLDVTLAVCEPKQLEFIKSIRDMCTGHSILEVSENRTPTDSMKDYFADSDLGVIDDNSYFANIIKQGVILGYVE